MLKGQVGDTFKIDNEEYEIVKFINSGAYGQIYLVEEINSKMKLVLKVVNLSNESKKCVKLSK